MTIENRRIPELDGIRGLAILLVLAWHYLSVPTVPALGFVHQAIMMTWSGVDLFFVLSGFLIGGILIDVRRAPNYFKTFYVRRAFRILPPYLALLLLAAATLCSLRNVLPYALFLQNLLMANWHSFGPSILSVTWSLAVEEQFYLTLPTLIALVPPKHLSKTIVILAVASAVFRSIAFLSHPRWAMSAYVLFPCRAEGLLLGVLTAIAFRDQSALGQLQRRRALVCGVGGAAGLVIAACWWMDYRVLGPQMSTFGYTVFAIFYASLLVLTLTSRGALKAISCWRWLRWLGIRAYGLYLIHVLALESAFRLFGSKLELSRMADLIPWTAAIAATLVIAELSWKFFESPLVKIGHRFAYRSAPSPSASAAGSSPF